MNKRRKGISLIVLVITILVMIILAGVVVVSLQKNNPIEKAKEANFKTDVSSFASELGVGLSNSLVENSSVKPEEIFANKFVDMKKYINSFSKKYENKLVIINGKLIYIGGDSKEKKWSEECGIEVFKGVNKPVLSEGMIPVKYENNSWVICSENDPSWYNYEQKLWANVMLSDGKYKDKNAIGTRVADADLGSMFVWIPRYAYSIPEYKKSKISGEYMDVEFLVGNGYVDVNGNVVAKDYSTDSVAVGERTPWIAHPAFGDKTGFYVAKYEASLNGTNYEFKPGKESKREIKFGDAFSAMYELNKNPLYGQISGETALPKNVEWGAICYFTASKYGVIPTYNETYTSGKNTAHSSTGNETGVYDLNGASWEFVATVENANSNNLQYYGNGKIKLWNEENTLDPKYAKYIDLYEVSEEEKTQKIADTVAGSGFLTHEELWNKDSKYNSIRRRLTNARFALKKDIKGDAVYEIASKFSYWGRNTMESYAWGMNTNFINYEYANGHYDKDRMLIGNTNLCFVIRGGDKWGRDGAGIFSVYESFGAEHVDLGFRAVIR